MYYCYILRNTDPKYKNLTYNGFTNDPFRRLRQHNEEIKGGAKATHGKNQSWEIYVLMTGFVDNHNALSCEWKIKHPTNKRQRPAQYCGQEGRVKSLNIVLPLKKWTEKCTINNNDCLYILYIVKDMYHLLDINKIPSNIVILQVDKITSETIKQANEDYHVNH